jgi:hypothetical protein
MKKIVASVGLFAVGASGLQAANVPGFSEDTPKPWSVSAALRGFYDDNVNGGTGSSVIDSYGFEVSPSFRIAGGTEQTSGELGAELSYKYYEKKINPNNSEHYDWSVTASGSLVHVFNERYQGSVHDAFAIGQEPDLLRASSTGPGAAFTTFQRIPGSNVRNSGGIDFLAQVTPLFGLDVGYDNALFHYADQGAKAPNSNNLLSTTGTGVIIPSAAGRLDLLQHNIHVNGRWTIQPTLVGITGYQYSQADYTGDEYISGFLVNGVIQPPLIANGQLVVPYKSDVRNARSHYGYLGVEDTLRPDLTGTASVGARYTDSYNDPSHNNNVSPYANLSLSYAYLPGSSLEGGFTYDYSATDRLDPSASGQLAQYSQSAVVHATITHRILPDLTGSLTAQFQDSAIHGGGADGKNELYYLVGLNFKYSFNQFLAAEVGYNYDKLDSQVANSFSRNRVYLGVTASY